VKGGGVRWEVGVRWELGMRREAGLLFPIHYRMLSGMTPVDWNGVVALAAIAGAMAGSAVAWKANAASPPAVAAESRRAANVTERPNALEARVAR